MDNCCKRKTARVELSQEVTGISIILFLFFYHYYQFSIILYFTRDSFLEHSQQLIQSHCISFDIGQSWFDN